MENEVAASEAGLAEAGRYATEREALQHSLVVLAMHRACWLVPSEEGWRLLVEPPFLRHAQYQLSCYDRESHGWPPPAAPIPRVVGRVEYPLALVWALILTICHIVQLELGPGIAALGRMDSRALWEHWEWWRPFTALFLHADYAHLSANVVSGLFCFAALTTAFQRGRAWLLLLLASLLGNLGAALLHGMEPYRSLGASTSVFAGLGLLTGRALRLRMIAGPRKDWRRVGFPLASGCALLGLFGAGGLDTDLGAHFFGFFFGALLGFLAGSSEPNRGSSSSLR